MADHLDTAAWAHLRGPAIAHARWSRRQSQGAVFTRVFRVPQSARAVSDAVDDIYRDVADFRTSPDGTWATDVAEDTGLER